MLFKYTTRALLLSSVLTLTACAALSGATAPTIYVLSPESTPLSKPTETGDRIIQVAMPQAAAGYETAAMLYVRAPYTLEQYTESQWVDTPARMLLPLLVQHLETTGQFAAVLSANNPQVAGEWLLNTEILQFQQEFLTVPSQIRLVVRLQLLDRVERTILTTATLEVTEPAPSEDAIGGVVAAQQAVKHMLEKIAAVVIPY